MATSFSFSLPDFADLSDALAEQGWWQCEQFLPQDYVKALADEVRAYWASGEFRRAGLGVNSQRTVRPEIRSDYVLWLEEDSLSQLQQQYWRSIDQLRQHLNQEFFLNLREFEAHFAIYPAGSFYKKHLDQFKTVPHRQITCILYLNEAWSLTDGGLLRLYFPDESGHRDIIPQAGNFLCFRSDSIYHEVLPSARERFSLTGWLKTA